MAGYKRIQVKICAGSSVVEQRPFKPLVVGSIPTQRTRTKKSRRDFLFAHKKHRLIQVLDSRFRARSRLLLSFHHLLRTGDDIHR